MAKEIEQFLMEKFSDGLDGKEKSSSKVPLHSQFQDLKGLIQKKLGPSISADALKILREKLYYLNKVLTECQLLSKKHGLYSSDELLFLYHTKRSLNRMIRELHETRDVTAPSNDTTVTIDSDQKGAASLPKDTETFQWSSRYVDASKVHGFHNEVMSVEKMLLQRGTDGRFKAIGIVGMGGIGKTTLAQLIFNKQEVNNYFCPRIWVCMPKQLNAEEDTNTRIEIVKRMLIDLGVEEEIIESVSQGKGLPGLLFALYLQLRGKRYLIVFDGVWNADKWYQNLESWLTQEDKWGDHLAYGLPKGYGGTIIVTSMIEEVAKKMVGEKNIYRLLPLSDPEACWSIFRDSVERDGKTFNPPNLENFKEEIRKKCAGLPLAAKIMGQIMYEQVQDEATRTK